MVKEMVVDVASRVELGKNVSRRLRRSGMIPAVLYGESKPPLSLSVNPKQIQAILSSESGGNTLFQLRLDGMQDKTRHVMIREPQKDPVSGALLHVDFVRIDTSKPVDVEVSVSIIGIAAGVKNDGGVLDFVGRTVEVSCLPTAIPEHMVVDVSEMRVGDVFRVKDLTVGEGVAIKSDPAQPLVVISSPRAEEVAAPEEGAAVPEEGAAAASEATEPAGEDKKDKKE